MMHVSYKHLPASGLGTRDPQRPHITGGLGATIKFFIPASLLRMRDNKRFGTYASSTVEGVRE